MTEILFNNTKWVNQYVASKIDFSSSTSFEEQVKYYIKHYCEKYLKVNIDAQSVYNYYVINYDLIMDEAMKNERERREEMEEIMKDEYEIYMRRAREDLMSKVHKNQKKTGRTAAYNLVSFRPLLDADKEKIYDEYEQAWN